MCRLHSKCVPCLTCLIRTTAVLSVLPLQPDVTYAQDSLELGCAAQIDPRSDGGDVTSWAITPALPDGLELNPFTGTISGTPHALASPRPFTVTAANASGSQAVVFRLHVVNGLPEVTYVSPVVLELDAEMKAMAPVCSRGQVEQYKLAADR